MNPRTAPDDDTIAPLRRGRPRPPADRAPDDQTPDDRATDAPLPPEVGPARTGAWRRRARAVRRRVAGHVARPTPGLGLLVLAALLGGLLGYAATGLLPTGSRATTSVLIHPLEGNPYSPGTQGSDLVNLETEAQVARSDAVVAAVADQLGGQLDRTDLIGHLDVAAGANTQVLEMTYRDPDPATARAVAELFAASYLEHRSTQRDAFLTGRQAALDTRIADLTRQLAVRRERGVSNADPEVKALGGQLLNLRLQSATIAAADVSPGQVIVAAQVAREGIRIPGWSGAAAGAVLGLAAAGALLRRRQRRAGVLTDLHEVEDLGLLVLAEESSAEADAPSAGARAAGFVLRRRSDEAGPIAVAPVGRAGPGPLAEDLAFVLADERDSRVLLVAGRTTDRSRDGLSEVLTQERSLGAVTQVVPGPGIRGRVVGLGLGRRPDLAEELFPSSRMTQVLDEAAARHHWVVVDGPDVRDAGGRALVATCRYWVPVVVAGRTTRRDLLRALGWAEAAGVTVPGCVLVPAEAGERAPAAEPDAAAVHGA